MRNIVIKLIELYQNTLSPDHGPTKALHPYGFCRHEPTCSEYAKQMIQQKGIIMGSIQSAWRILQCNPLSSPSDRKILSALQSK